jgi:hypothetical protein
MSIDRTETEYHLTQNGWVAGTFSSYGQKRGQVDPPPDRVESWLRKMEQSSGYAPGISEWVLVWESPDVPLDSRKELRSKYPFPPDATWQPYKKKRKKLADE